MYKITGSKKTFHQYHPPETPIAIVGKDRGWNCLNTPWIQNEKYVSLKIRKFNTYLKITSGFTKKLIPRHITAFRGDNCLKKCLRQYSTRQWGVLLLLLPIQPKNGITPGNPTSRTQSRRIYSHLALSPTKQLWGLGAGNKILFPSN